MERAKPETANLMDTHERLIADILTRYRTLIMLTTTHISGESSADLPSSASVSSISLRMEFDGLYSSVKELLTLSRKMKELWAFGPLGGREGEGERVEGDVKKVVELLGQLEGGRVKAGAEELGGSWEELKARDMGTFGQAQGQQSQGQAQSQPQTQTQTQTQTQSQGQSQPQQTAPNGTPA